MDDVISPNGSTELRGAFSPPLVIGRRRNPAFDTDDQGMLHHGIVIYDALYAWCRSLQDQAANWPPVMPAQSGAHR